MAKISVNTEAIDSLDIPADQKQAMKAQLMAQWQVESSQYIKEFERYKQDCRKRALEMAHGEMIAGMQPNAKISIAPGFKVTDVADKYYNWLISIPE